MTDSEIKFDVPLHLVTKHVDLSFMTLDELMVWATKEQEFWSDLSQIMNVNPRPFKTDHFLNPLVSRSSRLKTIVQQVNAEPNDQLRKNKMADVNAALDVFRNGPPLTHDSVVAADVVRLAEIDRTAAWLHLAMSFRGQNISGAPIPATEIKRLALIETFDKLSRCLVGMEACLSAHFVSRTLRKMGFQPRIIPAKYTKPFVKGQKNDYNDAEGIAEAALRPNLKLVNEKTQDQLDLQALHRVRSHLADTSLATHKRLELVSCTGFPSSGDAAVLAANARTAASPKMPSRNMAKLQD